MYVSVGSEEEESNREGGGGLLKERANVVVLDASESWEWELE